MSLIPQFLKSYWGLTPENQAAGASADAALRALALKDYGPGGKYATTDAQRASIAKNWANQESFDPATQNEEVDQAFKDELDARAKSIIGNPLDVFWQTIKSIFGALPWWVWTGAGIGVFYYFGGFKWLKEKSGK